MPEDFAPKPFRCALTRRDGATRLLPEGELDMSTVPEVERLLAQAQGDGAKRIVVDLSAVSFMDSTGITLLVRWHNTASRDGMDFALVQGDERIARLFALTGLTESFTFVAE